ncbi:MAG: MFS transporter [Candidatus Bathyarchaeota archaeon]|nr:MFS transporter [Candidatus Bathyarchaeota archaeon]
MLPSWLRLPEVFDRDLKLLLVSMSMRRVAMGFLQVVRAIYFALLGFSPVEIGLLLSIGTFVSALHSVSFGFLSDRFGRKPFIVIGGIFATLRMVIFAVSSDFWMLALGQGVGAMGEGAGAGQPVVSGYIAGKTNVENRSSIFSTLAVTNALAASAGSLMAGLPTYFQSTLALDVVGAHSLLFWIGAAGGFASFLFILPLKDVKAIRTTEEAEPQSPVKSRSWGVIARFSLIRATSGVGWGFIDSLLSLYVYVQFGVGGEVLGPVFAGARFLSVFSYILVPMIVNRFGAVSTIAATRLIVAGLSVVFSLTTWFPLAIALIVVMRVVLMFTMPIRQSFAAGLVEPRETATAIGISNFARMSVRTIAPTVAGYMFETISLTLPFFTGASFLAANGMLFMAFFGKRKNSTQVDT